jgi:hypothetical protein
MDCGHESLDHSNCSQNGIVTDHTSSTCKFCVSLALAFFMLTNGKSGTRYSIYTPTLTAPPRHQVPVTLAINPEGNADEFYSPNYIGLVPDDILQDFYAPISIAAAPTPILEAPLQLPSDDSGVKRALVAFDRNPTVDGHKIGVIYIDEGQTKETEILANTFGSLPYTNFISQLGTLTRLKGATFNTAGLDRVDDSDGKYAYCWRDRATELVFHVTTMMPTDLNNDPQCIDKKKHIGNDYVNIIWNESGADFKFDTFPSQFNYVYIVITPEIKVDFVAQRTPTSAAVAITPTAANPDPSNPTSRLLYKVQVLSAPGFPSISPAAETKSVSYRALAPFVRLLALNASFFSLVWAHREGGEHVSPWRNRLREIQRLRERYRNSQRHGTAAGEVALRPSAQVGATGLSGSASSGRAGQRTSTSFTGMGSTAENH